MSTNDDIELFLFNYVIVEKKMQNGTYYKNPNHTNKKWNREGQVWPRVLAATRENCPRWRNGERTQDAIFFESKTEEAKPGFLWKQERRRSCQHPQQGLVLQRLFLSRLARRDEGDEGCLSLPWPRRYGEEMEEEWPLTVDVKP